MKTAELKQYLKDVYELHSQCYSYGEIIDTYDAQANCRKSLASDKSIKALYEKLEGKELNSKAGYWLNITTCTGYENELKNRAGRESESKISNILFGASRVFFHLLWIVPILIAVIIFFLHTLSDAFGALIVGFLISTPVCLGIAHILSGISENIENKGKDKRLLEIIDEENEKANKHNELVIDKLINLRNSAVEPYNEASELLDDLYDQDIIHPKYRNLLAVAQIYEYFDTGRCTKLEGPDGAYNLYESELRQNIIIDRLDTIISQLDKLNRTMGYVVSAINQTNMLLSSISSSLYRIEANTALTAYNSQCIATNTQIANRYGYTYH